jgi:hypothetical protein
MTRGTRPKDTRTERRFVSRALSKRAGGNQKRETHS